jgi:hypothetical protein
MGGSTSKISMSTEDIKNIVNQSVSNTLMATSTSASQSQKITINCDLVYKYYTKLIEKCLDEKNTPAQCAVFTPPDCGASDISMKQILNLSTVSTDQANIATAVANDISDALTQQVKQDLPSGFRIGDDTEISQSIKSVTNVTNMSTINTMLSNIVALYNAQEIVGNGATYKVIKLDQLSTVIANSAQAIATNVNQDNRLTTAIAQDAVQTGGSSILKYIIYFLIICAVLAVLYYIYKKMTATDASAPPSAPAATPSAPAATPSAPAVL